MLSSNTKSKMYFYILCGSFSLMSHNREIIALGMKKTNFYVARRKVTIFINTEITLLYTLLHVMYCTQLIFVILFFFGFFYKEDFM